MSPVVCHILKMACCSWATLHGNWWEHCVHVALQREIRKGHRDPAGSWTRGLPNTSWTLLLLGHWTPDRGAETSLVITARLEASADFSHFSLSHSRKHCLNMSGIKKRPCNGNIKIKLCSFLLSPSNCIGTHMELMCSLVPHPTLLS